MPNAAVCVLGASPPPSGEGNRGRGMDGRCPRARVLLQGSWVGRGQACCAVEAQGQSSRGRAGPTYHSGSPCHLSLPGWPWGGRGGGWALRAWLHVGCPCRRKPVKTHLTLGEGRERLSSRTPPCFQAARQVASGPPMTAPVLSGLCDFSNSSEIFTKAWVSHCLRDLGQVWLALTKCMVGQYRKEGRHCASVPPCQPPSPPRTSLWGELGFCFPVYKVLETGQEKINQRFIPQKRRGLFYLTKLNKCQETHENTELILQ